MSAGLLRCSCVRVSVCLRVCLYGCVLCVVMICLGVDVFV